MRTAIAVVLVALCIGSAAYAQSIDKSAITAGGQLTTSGPVTLNANFGDVVSGASAVGTAEVQHGFWTTPQGQIVGVGAPRLTFVHFVSVRPNPVQESALIEFGVPAREEGVVLRVYDLSGRVVRELARGPFSAGVYQHRWDLRRGAGTRVASGMYFAELSTRSSAAVRRIVVLE